MRERERERERGKEKRVKKKPGKDKGGETREDPVVFGTKTA